MSEGRVWRLAEGEDQVAELMENLAGTVIGRLADVGREEDPDAGMLLHRLCMERHHWRIGRIAPEEGGELHEVRSQFKAAPGRQIKGASGLEAGKTQRRILS